MNRKKRKYRNSSRIFPLNSLFYFYSGLPENDGSFNESAGMFKEKDNRQPDKQIEQSRQAGQAGQVGRVGRVGQAGQAGQVGRVGRVGQVGQVGRVGQAGQVGQEALNEWDELNEWDKLNEWDERERQREQTSKKNLTAIKITGYHPQDPGISQAIQTVDILYQNINFNPAVMKNSEDEICQIIDRRLRKYLPKDTV